MGDVGQRRRPLPGPAGRGPERLRQLTLTPQANGQAYWRYSVDNSKTEIQRLGEGQLLHDSFTVHSADGTTQHDFRRYRRHERCASTHRAKPIGNRRWLVAHGPDGCYRCGYW
ncbi:hypothetical protein HT094_01100 [Shewanella sp. ZOR0012]|nr:hypothetical protein [Shewanella sp. ZOR0012]